MDLHDRILALCAKLNAWPQPSGKVRGLRAVQEAAAQDANPAQAIATMEKNLPHWMVVYQRKSMQYRRRLDSLMFDGDWRTDPFEEVEQPQEDPALLSQAPEQDSRDWYRKNLKFRSDAEMFALKPSTDEPTRKFLLELAQTLPGEHYKPLQVPASILRNRARPR